jgi:hypothetical protein
MPFAIGTIVLYNGRADAYGCWREGTWTGVVKRVWGYPQDMYLIELDGEIVGGPFTGHTETFARPSELKRHFRCLGYRKRQAVWLAEIAAYRKAEELADAKRIVDWRAEQDAKYAHLVPGAIVKWTVQEFQSSPVNYVGTVVSMTTEYWFKVKLISQDQELDIQASELVLYAST